MTAILGFAGHAMRWPTPLLALVLARAVNRLASFAMTFLAVTLVQVHHASVGTAGLVVGLFGLGTIPSRLVGGWLADRIGRRATIVGGLGACAVAQAVIGASPGLAGAVVGAALLGLSYEICEPGSQALVADLVDAERRAEAYGLLSAALAVAGLAAGALAAVVGGIDLRLLFVADAVTSLLAAVMVYALVRDVAGPAVSGRGGRSPWRDPRLLVMLAVGTGFALVWIIETVALPLTLRARGIDPARTGWLMLVGAVVTMAGPTLLRSVRAGRFALMLVGFALVAVGFAVVSYAAGMVGFALAAAVMAAGQIFLFGPPYSIVAELAGAGSRAGYLAAFGTCWGLAQTVGPLVATRLLAYSISTVWLAGAGLCLALACLMPVAGRVLARLGRGEASRELTAPACRVSRVVR